jgi:hypothetical protein
MSAQSSEAHPAEASAPAGETGQIRRAWRKTKITVVTVVALVLVYYLGGMIWLNQVDDDPEFAVESSAPPGGSGTVAMAADLIDREINDHRWVANDPFFMPASLLDNMPNFQQGIVAALSRFALELTDQIARTRGSSQVDPDLDRASGLLKYPGTVWIFDLRTSFAPTASSESQYRRAMQALRAYNERLAAGQAVFEARADNLLGTLDRIAADIGSSSAALSRHLDEESGWFPDFGADDLFYANKGRLYAYYLLLREMEIDFAKVIQEKDLGPAWQQMLDSFRGAASLQPWVIVNGAPDSQLMPSHLASQGFFLLRARTQMKEISNILLK